MQKDDGGGSGVAYDFDPTNISSRPFKVPAPSDPFYTTFKLCIDAVGVLR